MTVDFCKQQKKAFVLAAKSSSQEQTITLEDFESLYQASNSLLQDFQKLNNNNEMLSQHWGPQGQ